MEIDYFRRKFQTDKAVGEINLRQARKIYIMNLILEDSISTCLSAEFEPKEKKFGSRRTLCWFKNEPFAFTEVL